MITPEEFLAKELELGIHKDNPRFLKRAIATANQVAHLKDLSVIDYGAGTGVYAHALQLQGFEVKACDIWKVHRDYMKENYPDLKVIARPIQSDLMYFIEVAEHMTDEEIETAIEKISPEYILFSSTSNRTDGDEDWGHINIKSQAEWVDYWYRLGYALYENFSKPTKWTKLFKRWEV